MTARAVLVLTVLALSAAMSARADIISETVVAITCETPGKIPREGSGVVIAANGTILTAKHVVFGDSATLPDGTICSGSTGNANFSPDTLKFKKASVQYDAVLLKSPKEAVAYQQYCKLAPWMLRAQVIATGFPLESRTGVPSSRVGVLSTVEYDAEGIIETDTSTTAGLSGGMYTLASSGHLLGIVSGWDPDPLAGIVANYRMLTAEILAPEFSSFGLKEDTEGCAEKQKASGELGLIDGERWRAGDAPLKLGMREEEGLCFLTEVWGEFDDTDDRVSIGVIAGEYALTGQNGGGTYHGGLARCFRY